MLVKNFLIDWSERARTDLAGLTDKEVGDRIGVCRVTAGNYLRLRGQKKFDPQIIEKINGLRAERRKYLEALTQ